LIITRRTAVRWSGFGVARFAHFVTPAMAVFAPISVAVTKIGSIPTVPPPIRAILATAMANQGRGALNKMQIKPGGSGGAIAIYLL
jgi:hypothetical protein